MDANYRIEMDDVRGLLRLTVAGFWTPETTQAFVGELIAAVGPALRAGRNFAVLADCRNFPIQAAGVGEAFASYLKNSANTGKRAFVMGSMLGKLQAERILAHPSVRVFLLEAEAMDWLADDSGLAVME